MKDDEIMRLQRYLRAKFGNDGLAVRKRSQKDDSAEVYLGEEFLGVLYRDDEDPDDVSYNFDMAILEMDLPPK